MQRAKLAHLSNRKDLVLCPRNSLHNLANVFAPPKSKSKSEIRISKLETNPNSK
jgi:hypothetical protein